MASEGIRRLSKEVAAALLAAADAPGRGAPHDGADWHSLEACDAIKSAFLKLPLPVASESAAALVETDLVPRAARLLQQTIDRYTAAHGSYRDRTAATVGLDHVVGFAAVLGLLLDYAACVLEAARPHTTSYDRLPTAVRRLAGQLGELPTLQALAAAVRLAADVALPAAASAEAAAAATAATVTPAGLRLRLAAAGAEVVATSWLGSTRYMPGAHLVRCATMCLLNVLMVDTFSSTGGKEVRQRLADLRTSRLLGALCAAVLVPPPVPGPPVADEYAYEEGSKAMLEGLRQLYSVLFLVVSNGREFVRVRAVAVELVSAPEVARLRWEGLEQLAALGPGGVEDGEEEVAPGGAARPRRPCWPLLRCSSVEQNGRMARPDIMRDIVYAGVAPVVWDPAFGPAPPSAAAAAAAAGGRLPALAAPAARVLFAEAEALASASADPRAPPDPSLFNGLKVLAASLFMVVRDAPEAEKRAALPEVVEAFGWVLRAMAAPWGCADGAPEAVTRLSVLFKATQRACARRLAPTGLLRTLDVLLRRELAGDANGALEGHVATACTFLIGMLVPAIDARLEGYRAGAPLRLRHNARSCDAGAGAAPPAGRCGAGDGGPLWHPQDELGLVLTWAKLARREGAAAAARLPMGPAAAAPLGIQRLAVMGTLGANMGRVVHDWLGRGLGAVASDLQPRPPPGAAAAPAAGAQQQPPCPEAAQPAERVRVALLEAASLYNRSALQLLPAFCDGVAAFVASPSFSPARRTPAATDELAVVLKQVRGLLMPTIQFASAEELLAADPPRALAALGRMCTAVTAAMLPPQPPRRDRGAGAAAARSASAAVAESMRGTACEVSFALALMAADEQLVAAVVGWLSGGCTELDAAALVAAVGAWDREAAQSIDALCDAAAAADPARLLAEGRRVVRRPQGWWPGDAPEWGPGSAVRAERAVGVAAGRGLGGAPLWPPRVLRLCGNTGCCNLGGGGTEADLRLQQCSGCRVLRYCCAQCQREHWRQGHREECAAVAAVAAAGGC
ncbi:hypothetical protein TSOC_000841 [Tetrabaena socialis]|uniref:MYND-type domain-containing protein n=1 Tax=Tetrabaena socialis TaxID=47790 RepID=A0A2J8AIB9_9CHLO|nr:hypothetical protein TSOC_000841 [Tetrabaena socialis]|eukprot:PNH12257.1 hypothetical protein TSOC_000841 [Tetrabaena socialis]